MQFFATLWWPSLDLIGGSSLFAALLVSILVFLTGRFSFLPATARQELALLAPVWLLVVAAITEGSPVFYVWWHGRSFPDACDFAAAYIYLTFGFGYSLHLLRLPGVACRRMGSILGFVFGSFIVAEAVMKVHKFPHVFFGGWDVDWTPVVIALSVFAVVWVGLVRFLLRRQTPARGKPPEAR